MREDPNAKESGHLNLHRERRKVQLPQIYGRVRYTPLAISGLRLVEGSDLRLLRWCWISCQSLCLQSLEDIHVYLPLSNKSVISTLLKTFLSKLTWASVDFHQYTLLIPEALFNNWSNNKTSRDFVLNRVLDVPCNFRFDAPWKPIVWKIKITISEWPLVDSLDIYRSYLLNDIDESFLSIETSPSITFIFLARLMPGHAVPSWAPGASSIKI